MICVDSKKEHLEMARRCSQRTGFVSPELLEKVQDSIPWLTADIQSIDRLHGLLDQHG